MTFKLLNRLEQAKPFTEAEAWGLFRIAALSEAVGWSLLIAAILINKYGLPGHAFAVQIAGQIHGTFFIAYFAVLIATYSSLNWSRRKFFIAVIAGVPPYGTLIFEQWVARYRRRDQAVAQLANIVLLVVNNRIQLSTSSSV